jgi:hypothetical protein
VLVDDLIKAMWYFFNLLSAQFKFGCEMIDCAHLEISERSRARS